MRYFIFLIFFVMINPLLLLSDIGVKRSSLFSKDGSIIDIGRTISQSNEIVSPKWRSYEPTLINEPKGIKYITRKISPPMDCEASIAEYIRNRSIVSICPEQRQTCNTAWEYKQGVSADTFVTNTSATSSPSCRDIRNTPASGFLYRSYLCNANVTRVKNSASENAEKIIIKLGIDPTNAEEFDGFQDSSACQEHTENVTFNVAKASDVLALRIKWFYYDRGYAEIILNGERITKDPIDMNDGQPFTQCTAGKRSIASYNIQNPATYYTYDISNPEYKFKSFSPCLRDGDNTLTAHLAVPGHTSKANMYAIIEVIVKKGTSIYCSNMFSANNHQGGSVLTPKVYASHLHECSSIQSASPINAYHDEIVDSADQSWQALDYGGICDPADLVAGEDAFGNPIQVCNGPTPPVNNCRRFHPTCPSAPQEACAKVSGAPITAQYTNAVPQIFLNNKNPLFKICKTKEIAEDGKCFMDIDDNKKKDNFTGSCPSPYTQTIIDKAWKCARTGDCPVGSTQNADGSCSQDSYKYNKCACPDEYEADIEWGDQGIAIVPFTPFCPPLNCHKGNIPTLKSTFRPLQRVLLKGGLKPGYGSFVNTLCSDIKTGLACEFRLTHVYADTNGKSLCFEDALGTKGCVGIVSQCAPGDQKCRDKEPDCTFSGDVKELTQGVTIKTGIQQMLVDPNNPKSILLYSRASSMQITALGTITSTCDMEGKVGHTQAPFNINGHITNIRANGSRIEFWDKYRRGFIGAIEFVPQIPPEDKADGYVHIDQNMARLHDDGFILFTKIGDYMYAVHKDSISQTDCQALLHDTAFNIPQARSPEEYLLLSGFSFEGNFIYNYNNLSDIVGNYRKQYGSCVIRRKGKNQTPFYLEKNSVKLTPLPPSQSGATYQCSPFRCDSLNQCQTASCVDGTTGTILKPKDQIKATDQDLCTDQVCDYHQNFFFGCGIKDQCDTSKKNIFEIKDASGNLKNSKCVKATCPNGVLTSDEYGTFCKKYACPQRSIQDPNDPSQCIYTKTEALEQ